ncbi:MAG: peptidoglycan-binding protein [Ilumatobacteraceae bacterium]|jgi:SpoIID/LytB domain protein
MRIPLISFKSRIAAFLCAASLIVGLVPAQVAQAEEGQLPGGVIIYGRGFGHGRGLSQYGAYGWATVHGWSWEQILDFYYGGATGNSRSNLEAPNQEMTTWLSAMNNRQTGVVSDSGTMRLLEDPDQGRRFTSMVAREKSGAQRVYQVWGSGERKCLNESDSPEAAGFTLIGEFNETASFVTNSSQDPGASALDTVGLCEPRSASANQVRYYRGIVRAMNNTKNENRTINIARLDDYLRGVVPRESPASWGDTAGGAGMNALRAQAVAARSYSVTENRYAGLAKTCDTQDCQVYGGAALRTSVNASPTVLESANTDRAVAETTGVVIRNPKGNVVRTEFSSSNGGRTAGGEFPALADEGDISANSSLMIWTRAFSAAQIVAKYPQVGVLTSVTTTNDGLGGDFGGYTLDVTIAGTSGSVKVSGWAFRTAFGLPAPWFGATPVFGAPLEAGVVGSMLFVGDSIGQSIATEFSAIVSPAYPSVNFQALANRCMVGPSCVTPDKGLPDAIGVVNSLSAEQFPQIAIVQLGYNDDPNTMAGDVAAVINALNARNVQRIVFVNLSTRRASQNYALSNAALTAAAQTNPNVSVLDWNAASSDPSASRWFSDDVHLTATGRAEFTLFLRKQLDELRAQGLITPNPESVLPLAVPLIVGNRGEPVSQLQAALNTALGLKKKQKLSTDGNYGKGTAGAVSKIEELNGLPVDGLADATVLSLLGLDPTTFKLSQNSRHTSVATAQTALARVLKIKMKADGIFGSGTAKQLKRFQKSVGLKQTGVIDRTTWLSLLAASATLAK